MNINTNLYILDTDNYGFPEFTENNLRFVWSVVNLDSSYNASFNKNIKRGSANLLSHGFPDPEKDDNLRKAIDLIANENSTHTSKDDRKAIYYYIYDNYDMVKNAIESGDRSIIRKIALLDAASLDAASHDKTGKAKFNISFASKFCTFSNRFCFNKDDFSIVDHTLCSILPYYEFVYNLEDYEKHCRISKNKDIVSRWEDNKNQENFYQDYCNTIGALIKSINKSNKGLEVNRADFDLLLWYCFKNNDEMIRKALNCIKIAEQ